MVEATQEMLRAVIGTSSLAASPHAVAVRAADGSTAEVGHGRLGGDLDLTADTVMYAGSIAKQVVGLIAARQVVNGLLDPDDELSLHIDGLPAWAGRVRLRHLVHHTSGLADVVHDGDGRGNADVLGHLRHAAGPVTEPGSVYSYSNLGYICLAEVLHRAAGSPVEALAGEIFESLGMPTAQLGGAMPADIPHQQRPPRTVGDGGLWLSARGLRCWNDALNSRALGDAVHALAERPGELDDGTPLDYAWGVRIVEHAGRRTFSHGGSWPTWSAKAVRQPDTGISVAVLTTSEDAHAITSLALALTDAIAG